MLFYEYFLIQVSIFCYRTSIQSHNSQTGYLQRIKQGFWHAFGMRNVLILCEAHNLYDAFYKGFLYEFQMLVYYRWLLYLEKI